MPRGTSRCGRCGRDDAEPAEVLRRDAGEHLQQRRGAAGLLRRVLRGRDERGVVRRLDEEQAQADDEEDHRHLDDHQDAGDAAGQLGAEDRHDRQRHDDERGAEVRPGLVAGQPRRQVEELLQVCRPAPRHHRRAQRQLQAQVPADDPGDELPEGGVGEGVCRAGDRHRGGELRVAQCGQRAHDAGQGERQHDGGPGVAGGLLPGEHEDARADDHSDPEDGQVEGGEVLAQPVAGFVGVAHRLFDRFGAKKRRHG
jgi:hypothetical protein